VYHAEAIVRRLEELGLIKPDTWDWFQANGWQLTDDQARQVLGDLSTPDAYKADADRPTTLRLNMLASEVHRKGLLSEGQLARLLKLDRVELREILGDIEWKGAKPMEPPPSLIRPETITADASTVINLNATGPRANIVQALAVGSS